MSLQLNTVLAFTILVACCLPHVCAMYDCSGGVHHTHLEKMVDYKGCFHDGQGAYVGKVNVTKPYIFPIVHECWYDIYVMHAVILKGPFRPASSTQ
jgi:hypothetical protein